MSTTIGGIITILAGTYLTSKGFTGECIGQVMNWVTPLILAGFCWFKRVQQGDINWVGIRK